MKLTTPSVDVKYLPILLTSFKALTAGNLLSLPRKLRSLPPTDTESCPMLDHS